MTPMWMEIRKFVVEQIIEKCQRSKYSHSIIEFDSIYSCFKFY